LRDNQVYSLVFYGRSYSISDVSGLHSLDSVGVDLAVGLDGSLLGSTESLESLNEVFFGSVVFGGGSLSKCQHVSSVGTGLFHGVMSLNVSALGVSVFVVGLNHGVVGGFSVVNGLDEVLFHVSVGVGSFFHVVDRFDIGFVSSV